MYGIYEGRAQQGSSIHIGIFFQKGRSWQAISFDHSGDSGSWSFPEGRSSTRVFGRGLCYKVLVKVCLCEGDERRAHRALSGVRMGLDDSLSTVFPVPSYRTCCTVASRNIRYDRFACVALRPFRSAPCLMIKQHFVMNSHRLSTDNASLLVAGLLSLQQLKVLVKEVQVDRALFPGPDRNPHRPASNRDTRRAAIDVRLSLHQ